MPAGEAAAAVVTEALAAPALRLRSSAIGLVESLGEEGGRFLPALRERAGSETDPRLREQITRTVAALEAAEDGEGKGEPEPASAADGQVPRPVHGRRENLGDR